MNIGFGTEHELAALPIVTNLAAASDTTWFDAAVGDLAPFVAKVQASIRASPIIDARGRRIVRRRAAWEICGGGSASNHRREGCRHDCLFHLALHSTPALLRDLDA